VVGSVEELAAPGTLQVVGVGYLSVMNANHVVHPKPTPPVSSRHQESPISAEVQRSLECA
jgi:hypothetical protein